MTETNRVLVIGWSGAHNAVTANLTNTSFTMIKKSGHWELFSSDRPESSSKSE